MAHNVLKSTSMNCTYKIVPFLQQWHQNKIVSISISSHNAIFIVIFSHNFSIFIPSLSNFYLYFYPLFSSFYLHFTQQTINIIRLEIFFLTNYICYFFLSNWSPSLHSIAKHRSFFITLCHPWATVHVSARKEQLFRTLLHLKTPMRGII